MSLDALIMLAGGFVAVLPFLGFPSSWDTVFLFIIGVIIIGLGVIVRRRLARRATADDLAHRQRDVSSMSAPHVPMHENETVQ